MAATKKSTKRSKGKRARGKKRASAKRSPARKSARSGARKTTSKRRTKAATARAAGLKRTARQGLRAARDGIDTVKQAGEKTWEVLKSTTAQVVEGVRDTMTREPEERRGGMSEDRFDRT
jgi:hypothetical protein